MTIEKYLFIIYILLLPFDATELPCIDIGAAHIAVADMLLFIILYIIIIKLFCSNYCKFLLFDKLFWLLAIAIISSMVNLFWIENYSYDIKITLNYIEYFALFFVVTFLVSDIRYLKKIFTYLIIASVGLASLAIINSLGVSIPGFQRHTQLMVHSFHLGEVPLLQGVINFDMMVLAGMPLILEKGIIKRAYIRGLFFTILLLGAWISYTRGLWISLLGEFILYLYLSYFQTKLITLKMFFISLLTCLVGIVTIYFKEIFNFIVSIRPVTYYDRIGGMQFALHNILDNIGYFLFGMGKGDYINKKYNYMGSYTVIHNFIMDTAISKGIIVSLAICLIITVIIYNLYRAFKHSQNINVKRLALILLVANFGMLIDGNDIPLTTSLSYWTFLAITLGFINLWRRSLSLGKFRDWDRRKKSFGLEKNLYGKWSYESNFESIEGIIDSKNRIVLR